MDQTVLDRSQTIVTTVLTATDPNLLKCIDLVVPAAARPEVQEGEVCGGEYR